MFVFDLSSLGYSLVSLIDCAYVYAGKVTTACIWRWDKVWDSVLSTLGVQVFELGCQALLHSPLPIKPSHQTLGVETVPTQDGILSAYHTKPQGKAFELKCL